MSEKNTRVGPYVGERGGGGGGGGGIFYNRYISSGFVSWCAYV